LNLGGAGGVPDARRLEFSFTLTRAEHLRAFDDLHPLLWWHLVPWITAPGGNARRRAAAWLAGAFLLVLGVPLLFARAQPRLALIGPLLIASAWTWITLLRALRRRAAAVTFDRTEALRLEQRWRLTSDGVEIEYSTPGARRTALAWLDVLRVEETRDGFGFVVSLQRTGFLPRRAVGEASLAPLRELIVRAADR